MRDGRSLIYLNNGDGTFDALLRLWEFYLCYCEAAYAEEYVSLVQLKATKP